MDTASLLPTSIFNTKEFIVSSNRQFEIVMVIFAESSAMAMCCFANSVIYPFSCLNGQPCTKMHNDRILLDSCHNSRIVG